jgi:hypothetical protein
MLGTAPGHRPRTPGPGTRAQGQRLGTRGTPFIVKPDFPNEAPFLYEAPIFGGLSLTGETLSGFRLMGVGLVRRKAPFSIKKPRFGGDLP